MSDEKNDYLTIADISRRTGISERSLRRYRDEFQVFIPYSGQGRQRVHPEEAIPIFERIAGLKNKGRTGRQIASVLNHEINAINAEIDEEADSQAAGRHPVDLAIPNQILSVLPALSKQNQQIIQGLLELIGKQDQRMDQLQQTQDKLVDGIRLSKRIENQKAQLRKKDEKIKALEDQLRQNSQPEQQKKKKPKKWRLWFDWKD